MPPYPQHHIPPASVALYTARLRSSLAQISTHTKRLHKSRKKEEKPKKKGGGVEKKPEKKSRDLRGGASGRGKDRRGSGGGGRRGTHPSTTPAQCTAGGESVS
eukprot:2082634-Rhodomonas_salina.1